MKKLKLNYLLLFVLTLSVIVHESLGMGEELDEYQKSTYSVNPPPQRTGAPGENDCTQCHSGNLFNATGSVDYSFSGTQNQYYPDSTYTITLGTDVNPTNGFEMTILDGNALQAGTFSAGTASTVVSSGLREYARHSDPNNTSWTFQWTAPSTDMGNLTAYFTFNKTDNSGTSAGDSIFIGQETIFISPSADLLEINPRDPDYRLTFISEKQELLLNLSLEESASVSVSVHNLTGKRVFFSSLGNLNPGNYHELFSLKNSVNRNILIITLQVGNNYYQDKIIL